MLSQNAARAVFAVMMNVKRVGDENVKVVMCYSCENTLVFHS